MAPNLNLNVQELQALDNGVRTLDDLAAQYEVTRHELLDAMEDVGYYEWNGSRIHGTPGKLITINLQCPYPQPDVEIEVPETATFRQVLDLIAVAVQLPVGGFVVFYERLFDILNDADGPNYILNNGAWHKALRYFKAMEIAADWERIDLTAAIPDQAPQYVFRPFCNQDE